MLGILGPEAARVSSVRVRRPEVVLRKAPAPVLLDDAPNLRGAAIRRACPAGVIGSLAQMPLTEILQTMDFGKKTARVEVFFDERTSGLVHVHDGQIVRATALTADGEWTGELAFVELCRRGEGHFRLDYTREAVERNVQRPTTFVLLEAMRVIDESSSGPRAADADAAPAGGEPGWDEPWSDGDGGAQQPIMDLQDASAIDIEVATEAPLQQHPRYRVGARIEIRGGDSNAAPRSALLEDISLGGAYVATEAPIAAGARLRLGVPTAAGQLVLHAAVAHVLDAQAAASVGRNAGVGVSFADLAPDAAAELATFIEGLKTSRGPSSGGGDDGRDRLLSCLAESELLVAAGDLSNAQRVLKQAHGLAPTDDHVRRRLMKVNEAIDAAQANTLLERALRGAPNAVDMAVRAMQLRPTRDVLLRALGVFARAGAHDEITDVAEQLLELDANDEGALRTLLDANIAMERWSVALRAGEALVRLHPGDARLKAQLQKVVQQARRPSS